MCYNQDKDIDKENIVTIIRAPIPNKICARAQNKESTLKHSTTFAFTILCKIRILGMEGDYRGQVLA